MEKLRQLVKEMMNGTEEELKAGALTLFLELLKAVPEGQWYEVQSKIRTLTKQFCSFFMACLAVFRSRQQIDKIGIMEKSFSAKEEETQIQFLTKVLELLCVKGNPVAIEIASYFLHAYPDAVIKCAKDILVKAGKGHNAKSLVTSVLQCLVPGKTCALSIIAEIDPLVATGFAVEILKHEDEYIRHEALCVLAESTISKETANKVIEHLKGNNSKILWEDSDHLLVVYDFISNSFKRGLLSEADAKTLIAKAFCYEDGNRGLGKLMPVAKLVGPKDANLLFDGFVAMESHGKFAFRKETVKEFISTLKGGKRTEYLRKALLASNDDKFAWFAGQHLIAANVSIAGEVFVECAKQKGKEYIGTLSQLAMKVCYETRGSWSVEALNKSTRSRFAGVANALFAFAETRECPMHTRLTIACQPGMFGGTAEHCRKANGLLDRIISKSTSSQHMLEALQALLNCRVQKEALRGEIDLILNRAYVSKNKQLFLEQLSEIMCNDVRGYPVEPLFRPVVEFLEGVTTEEAIPMLSAALHAAKPDADLGLEARARYIKALAKFALKGSTDAVKAISEYRGENICGETIPKTLADIYKKAAAGEVKEEVARAVADRFIYSVVKEVDTRVFYLYELNAVEVLKDEPIVQQAFLDGMMAIGELSTNRSKGMCGIIKKIPVIMPETHGQEVRIALVQLVEKLEVARKERLSEIQRWPYSSVERDDSLNSIDAISAEAGLALTIM